MRSNVVKTNNFLLFYPMRGASIAGLVGVDGYVVQVQFGFGSGQGTFALESDAGRIGYAVYEVQFIDVSGSYFGLNQDEKAVEIGYGQAFFARFAYSNRIGIGGIPRSASAGIFCRIIAYKFGRPFGLAGAGAVQILFVTVVTDAKPVRTTALGAAIDASAGIGIAGRQPNPSAKSSEE